MIRIALAGSRSLGFNLFSWLIENKIFFNILIVGGVSVNFQNWWSDKIKNLYKENEIENFNTIEELIDKTKPDMLFSINYWKIIPYEYLKKVKKNINIHHSYKLRIKGRFSTSWAIIKARSDNYWIHGTSIHLISKDLDSGKIILSEKCRILKDDTANTLFKRVEIIAENLFKNNLKYIISDNYKIIKPDTVSYYFAKDSLRKYDENTFSSVEHIYDYVRAWTFDDRPSPYLKTGGKKVDLSIKDENLKFKIEDIYNSNIKKLKNN
jgi:methionyl-tRNA formyltransferase